MNAYASESAGGAVGGQRQAALHVSVLQLVLVDAWGEWGEWGEWMMEEKAVYTVVAEDSV